jgi:methylenetetrahydrofolate reductase (NADPH)
MVLSPVSDTRDTSLDENAVRLDLTTLTRPTLSFEFFPPKTEAGFDNLVKRLESMSDMNPVWIDVTFGAGGSTPEKTIEICDIALKKCKLNVLMHLTCTNSTRACLDTVLERMKAIGVRNILALRGDPPSHTAECIASDGEFNHAADLVRYIRSRYGDYFCIGVAGYPEGHADCESFESDIRYLKEKVSAGADMIITQFFYDVNAYFNFLQTAREAGINVPIIPGIMPIMSVVSLKRMTTMCKVSLPTSISEHLLTIENDDDKVKAYGVSLAAEMCKELLSKEVPGVHLYTMNNEENIRKIVKAIAPFLPSKHSIWLQSDQTRID